MTRVLTTADVERVLTAPGPDDDKFSRGVVGMHTGSTTYPGAAVLGVSGAWRAGAGMVRWIGDREVGRLVLERRPETVLRDGWVGCRVIGSGTDAAERTAAERDALVEILRGPAPVVVDAGALDLLGEHSAPVVITPHAGEFGRLQAALGTEPTPDRSVDAARMASATGAVVVLKGAETLIAAPGDEVRSVAARAHWLATAGTGDVLAGAIGTIVAQAPNAPLVDAVSAAVWLHARAARLASGVDPSDPASDPGRPITALDVAEALPAAVHDLLLTRG